eukprot:c788_g1_i2.p1 GENE.c788_g1_i2~~c788_g1_i2.p1  ORF type:complete len:137 (+),score=19.59 c788_g1_i2:44-454(+)
MLHLFLLALVTTSTTENIANARQLGLLSVAHQSQSAPSPVVTPPVVNSCLLAFRALILFAFFLILALVCLYWRNHRVFVLRVEQELERRHKKPAVFNDLKYRTLDLLTAWDSLWWLMCLLTFLANYLVFSPVCFLR